MKTGYMNPRILALYQQLSYWDKVRQNVTEGFSDDMKYDAHWNYLKVKQELESL